MGARLLHGKGFPPRRASCRSLWLCRLITSTPAQSLRTQMQELTEVGGLLQGKGNLARRRRGSKWARRGGSAAGPKMLTQTITHFVILQLQRVAAKRHLTRRSCEAPPLLALRMRFNVVGDHCHPRGVPAYVSAAPLALLHGAPAVRAPTQPLGGSSGADDDTVIWCSLQRTGP